MNLKEYVIVLGNKDSEPITIEADSLSVKCEAQSDPYAVFQVSNRVVGAVSLSNGAAVYQKNPSKG